MLLGMAAPAVSLFAQARRKELSKCTARPLPGAWALPTRRGVLPYCPRHVWVHSFVVSSLLNAKTKVAVVIVLKKNVLFIEGLCDLILYVCLCLCLSLSVFVLGMSLFLTM